MPANEFESSNGAENAHRAAVWLERNLGLIGVSILTAVVVTVAFGTVLAPDPAKLNDGFEALQEWNLHDHEVAQLQEEHLIYQDEILLQILSASSQGDGSATNEVGVGTGSLSAGPSSSGALETWQKRRARLIEELELDKMKGPLPDAAVDVRPGALGGLPALVRYLAIVAVSLLLVALLTLVVRTYGTARLTTVAGGAPDSEPLVARMLPPIRRLRAYLGQAWSLICRRAVALWYLFKRLRYVIVLIAVSVVTIAIGAVVWNAAPDGNLGAKSGAVAKTSRTTSVVATTLPPSTLAPRSEATRPNVTVEASVPARHDDLRRELPSRFGVEDADVYSVTFAPDGTKFATNGATSIRIWASANNGLLCDIHVGEGFNPLYVDMKWSPNGVLLAIASNAGAAFIWDTQQCTPQSFYPAPGERVFAVEFVDDGRTLVTASSPEDDADSAPSQLRWYDLGGGAEPVQTRSGPGTVWRMTSNGESLYVVTDGGTVQPFGSGPERAPGVTIESSISDVRQVSFDTRRSELIVGGDGGLWLMPTAEGEDDALSIYGDDVEDFAAVGEGFVVVGESGAVEFANIGGISKEPLVAISDDVLGVAVSRDQRQFIAVGRSGMLTFGRLNG
ncbi:MAG: WD40 repeat domain-containing protein [Microthrixaceae bacterium]